MLFRGLKDRRVIVNYAGGEAFRGTVSTRGLFSVRLVSAEALPGGGQAIPLDGVVRLRHRHVTWIQEL